MASRRAVPGQGGNRMHDEIRRILGEIRALEGELREKLHAHEERLAYRIRGRRIEFTEEIRAAHRKARVGIIRWVASGDIRNILSAPFIFALIIPFALLDLFLCVYHAVCFRLYRLPPVPRADYVVIDRHHLHYLNILQKLNCVYCGYVNGVISWARELASVTEQYWCPIKHARKVRGSHTRYAQFIDYGDAEALAVRVVDLREELRRSAAEGNA
jgi:hypothetical protein